MIAHSFSEIKKLIHQQEALAGRPAGSAQLVAVSKKQDVDKIREAYGAGQRVFAENYIQEALEKKKALADLNIEWHFIGRLQGKKIKTIVGEFSLIHSLESLKQIQEISRRALEKSIIQDVLLQVNLVQEASKGGFAAQDLLDNLPQLIKIEAVQIKGLMFMPPLYESSQQALEFYKKAAEFSNKMSKSLEEMGIQSLELSMGTTADFKEAIQCGATLVRLGRSLFGERDV